MNYHILKEYNFTEPEIELLQILIEQGESTVSTILTHTTLSRTSVHDALNSLLAKDILEYRKEGRNAYYKSVHPNKLYAVLEEKKQATARLNAEMEEVIRSMVGSYNVSESKPGVRFFEGVEGIKQALNDSLNAKEPILTMGDMEIALTNFKEVNDEYISKRKKKGIHKLAIGRDTENIRLLLQSYDTTITSVRLLSDEKQEFKHIVIEVYDNTISFLTLKSDTLHAVLINSPQIASVHKSLFFILWNQAAEISS
jgi:sugar-specific transcriptional regulator TrmB